jgi:hypothetical protein
MFDHAQGKQWVRLTIILEDNVGKGKPNGGEAIDYALRELRRMADIYDAKTTDDISNKLDESEERNTNRLTNAIYALLAAIFLPLTYPIVLWVIDPIVLWILAGFRRSKAKVNPY